MSIDLQSIREQVTREGYCLVKYSEAIAKQDVLAVFGSIVQTTEIRESSTSTRLLASSKPMDFHTDHFSAKFIAWFCNSQSATGGESLLIDMRHVISQYSEAMVSLLHEVYVKTHKVFVDDKSMLPMLAIDSDDNQPSVYYASWLVCPTASIKHQRALEKFEADLKQAQQIELLLSEGDMLIIDNHRMLHGRAGFPLGSGRWLTRYWLK